MAPQLSLYILIFFATDLTVSPAPLYHYSAMRLLFILLLLSVVSLAIAAPAVTPNGLDPTKIEEIASRPPQSFRLGSWGRGFKSFLR